MSAPPPPGIFERIAELEQELASLRRLAGASSTNEYGSAEWPRTLLESVINNTQNVIYVKDLSGRHLLVNDRFCEIFGLPRESIIGKPPAEISPSELSTNHLANDQLVSASRKAITFVERLDLADGRHEYISTKFPIFDAAGKVVAVGGISTDVTAQKKAELLLRESEERFRLTFHGNPLAIALNRLSNGEYVDSNDSFTRILGYSREEVLGKTAVELGIWLDPGERERMIAELKANGRVDRMRFRFRRKTGELVTGEMSCRVLTLNGEEVILSLTRDITQELDLEDRYRQAQKMEAIGRLAGGVAHDFNNLLVPVLSYAEMVKERVGSDRESAAMLDEILHAGSRAAQLTRQILAFSRKQVLNLMPLDLNQLIGGFRTLIGRLLKEDIEIRVLLAPGIGNVRADRMQIEQILMNLAVNAGDAMPDGGALTIETGEREMGGEAGGRFADTPVPGRCVTVTVTDTGAGMSADTLQHIFEPFFTTKGQGQGTGLGLATVFGIVKQHGGNVWVRSETGNGSTFRIYLPVTGQAVSAPDRNFTVSGSRGGGETILVVEDDEHVRELVCTALNNNGYRVVAAANAEEALRTIEEEEPRKLPALLLTDVIMPGTNGRELHQAIAGRIPGLRVLFMSGYADEVIARHGLLEQGRHLLQKPFAVRDLLLKVRAALDG
jgi:two-component system, cell cycle sensor histidine kinase and response regulator CckA